MEDLQSLDSADRTTFHFHECFVDRTCGRRTASDLGFLAKLVRPSHLCFGSLVAPSNLPAVAEVPGCDLHFLNKN